MVTRMLRSEMRPRGGGRVAHGGARSGLGMLPVMLIALMAGPPGTASATPVGAHTHDVRGGDAYQSAAPVQLAQLPRSLIEGNGTDGIGTDGFGRSMATPVQGFSSDYAATVETRIQSLEREISRLTGQVEELRFRNEQLSSRLDRVLNDVEFRLSELEGADRSAPGDADSAVDQSTAERSGGGSPEGSETPEENDDDNGDTSIVGDGDMSDTVRTLGTIPLSPGRPSPPSGSSPQSSTESPGTGQSDSGQSDSGESDSPASVSGVLADDGDSVASLPQPRPQDDGAASRDYDEAYGLLTGGRYAEAEEAFQAFIDRHPDHRLSDNARYWLGETFYIRDRYEEAARTFANAYQQSPEGNKAPDNLLKLGLSLASLDQTEDACTALERVTQSFPDAPETISERAREERSRLSC